jgi:hypothetical protein
MSSSLRPTSGKRPGGRPKPGRGTLIRDSQRRFRCAKKRPQGRVFLRPRYHRYHGEAITLEPALIAATLNGSSKSSSAVSSKMAMPARRTLTRLRTSSGVPRRAHTSSTPGTRDTRVPSAPLEEKVGSSRLRLQSFLHPLPSDGFQRKWQVRVNRRSSPGCCHAIESLQAM